MTAKKAQKGKKPTTSRGYSKAKAKFILDKVSGGMSLTNIHNKHPEQVPEARHIWNWAKKNEDFREELTIAYDLFIRSKVDELEYVSTASLSQLFPNLDAREGAEARRARMDCLKFLILKVAPFYTHHWEDKRTVKVEGMENAGTTVVIANYSLSEDEIKVVNANPAIAQIKSTLTED